MRGKEVLRHCRMITEHGQMTRSVSTGMVRTGGSSTCKRIEEGDVIRGCVDSLIKLLIEDEDHTFASRYSRAVTLCHRL